MFLWVDVETTGLSPEVDALLEVALVVTDNDGNAVGSAECVLPFDLAGELNGGRKIDQYVVDMHHKSELWLDCARQFQVEKDEGAVNHIAPLLDLARKFTEAKTTPICGSTIAFDRAFLKRHMPLLEAHFSHRNFDVSVLGECAARWAPDVYTRRPKGGAHRAMADILGSIELMKFWRRELLVDYCKEAV